MIEQKGLKIMERGANAIYIYKSMCVYKYNFHCSINEGYFILFFQKSTLCVKVLICFFFFALCVFKIRKKNDFFLQKRNYLETFGG